MHYFLMIFVCLGLLGCSGVVNRGDYVTYTSDEYTFLADTFLNKSMDCIELGQIEEGDFDVKYCVGFNYASKLVQGFVFEHYYENDAERFIGATLEFKAKKRIRIECNSEIIDGKDSGKEYVNCMVPQKHFDLYPFLLHSPEEVQGSFKAAVGADKVYHGVIGAEGKALLYQFYKDISENEKGNWKERRL